MEELLDRKKDIITEHLPKLIDKKEKANRKILKLMKKALKDHKISADVHIGITKKIEVGGQIKSNSSTQMNGEQKVEMVGMWLENAKTIIDDVRKDDKFTESYFKSIDKEMEYCRQEMKKIDEELKHAKDDDARKLLLEKQKKQAYIK